MKRSAGREWQPRKGSARTLGMDLIASTEALAAACARLAAHPFVTVDTEFLRETTYYPKLCLIQMASSEEAVLVDPPPFVEGGDEDRNDASDRLIGHRHQPGK